MLQIQRGRVKRPDFILIYGTDGVGKTTFGSQMPSPVFVGPERGADNLDVARLPVPEDYIHLVEQVESLAKEKHDFKSVVLDSLDHVEPLIWSHVCKAAGVMNIEEVGGGFGKGFTIALKEWDRFLRALEALRANGMNVCMIGHSQVKAFTDPATGSTYDRYLLKMNEKASALCRERADSVLFASFRVYTKGKEGQKHRAFGDGTRIMYTERRPAFDAKNRFGLPVEMRLDYQEYRVAVDQDSGAKLKELIDDIDVLKKSADANLVVKVTDAVTKAGKSVEQLTLIRERLRSKLEEKTNVTSG